jgi:NTP pyrophosphatase (non-canonical NTP hydrolase)
LISEATLKRLLAFRDARDWRQFHTFRNLAISISLEAAELLEHAQWVPDTEMNATVEKNRNEIRHEIADIAMYLALLAHDLGVDIDECVQDKLALNEQKYPVAKSRGRSTKYDRLD